MLLGSKGGNWFLESGSIVGFKNHTQNIDTANGREPCAMAELQMAYSVSKWFSWQTEGRTENQAIEEKSGRESEAICFEKLLQN